LKLNYTYAEFSAILEGNLQGEERNDLIQSVVYDTRKVVQGEYAAFFALKGEFRDGHDFIANAFDRGIRLFIVTKPVDFKKYTNSIFITVPDTLVALQRLAMAHRLKFTYPVIAITGSVGKTMVKEWAYHFLSAKFRVIRSPKSYNSQLGVALSLLGLHSDCDMAIIEAGISKGSEMDSLEKMIQPTIGIFTAFGSAHSANFSSQAVHLEEKLKLFKHCTQTFFHASIDLTPAQAESIHGIAVNEMNLGNYTSEFNYHDKVTLHNLAIAVELANEFEIDSSIIADKIETLPTLALRMETFEGINQNTIINDTYNIDFDAFRQSMEYQLTVAEKRKRVVIIGLDDAMQHKKTEIEQIIQSFLPDKVLFLNSTELTRFEIEKEHIEQAVVLIKGSRKADMQRVARQFRLKNHKTYVTIDLNAIRHNLSVFKSHLQENTKLLVMIKASSYGSGQEKMAEFLERQGVDYFGVAYADEGVELRKQGIKTPILVMNAEEDGFEDCINYNLEPAIYSFEQLDDFIKELIFSGKTAYPIHLKLDTGMRRLGFETEDMHRLSEILDAQPEVRVASVYTHLAESDNLDQKHFTELQIDRFKVACDELKEHVNYDFDRHVLNSEGITRFKEAQLEMVRLGIGIYGYSTNPYLQEKITPALGWYSSISQVKSIQKHESVGYGRSFIAKQNMKIAIIPIGYADGFRRSLSNGVGHVVILGQHCAVVGNVCMDMIMVDVSELHVKAGMLVEVVGEQQTLEQLAKSMQTIPYEVMTSISKRVHRIYLED
jgi:alanine racemase